MNLVVSDLKSKMIISFTFGNLLQYSYSTVGYTKYADFLYAQNIHQV